MKLRAERKALTDTVAWVGLAVPKRLQTAALGGIHLTATKGRLVLRAFDYDVSHAAVMPAEIATEGEALVPAAFLRGVLSGFKTAEVGLEVDGNRLVVTAGRARYSCPLLALDDFPKLPEVPAVVGHINADALAEAVGLTSWAISTQDMLPALTAIHVEASGDQLTMQSTDRFMLAECATTFTQTGDDFAANVPGRALVEAVKGMSDTVAICAEGGLFGLSDGDRTVTLRCIEAEFPALGRVIRTEDAQTVEVDAGDLLAAIKRAGVLSEKEGVVALIANFEGMSVSVPASEDGDGIEHLDATASGEVHVGVAPGKIAAALGAIGDGPVTLGFDGGKPIFLRTKREGLTVAVMPKRIGGAR